MLLGHGWEPVIVAGDDPAVMHRRFATALDKCHAAIRAIQAEARRAGPTPDTRWPMIVLRTPKGWTGPKVVDGTPIEGTFRAHQVPLANVKDNPEHLALLDAWMRSYRPEALFDDNGRLVPALAALAPEGDRRMGANPHANGGRVMVDLDLPDYTHYAIPVPHPATERQESTRALGELMRDIFTRTARQRTSDCSVRTRPTPIASAMSSRSRIAARRAGSSRTTTTSRPTAA